MFIFEMVSLCGVVVDRLCDVLFKLVFSLIVVIVVIFVYGFIFFMFYLLFIDSCILLFFGMVGW